MSEGREGSVVHDNKYLRHRGIGGSENGRDKQVFEGRQGSEVQGMGKTTSV